MERNPSSVVNATSVSADTSVAAAIRFVTASLKLDFRRPTPLGVELTLIGELAALEGRKARITLALSAGDTVCVTGEMLAVQLPARHD